MPPGMLVTRVVEASARTEPEVSEAPRLIGRFTRPAPFRLARPTTAVAMRTAGVRRAASTRLRGVLSSDHPGPRVVLVGPPGSGKSTVGAALAERWQLALRDTDSDVETVAGKPIAEIFVDDGEPAFRALERAAVAAAVAGHDGVLALGGGAVLDEGTQAVLAAYRAAGGAVVFLDVTLAHAAPRVGLNRSRPLLLGNPRAQWQALMDARRPVYERVATLRVLTDGLRPAQVAQEVEGALAQARAHGTDARSGNPAGEATTRQGDA